MTRTTTLLSAAVALAIVAGTAETALAQGMCEQLWVERNSIFKARGYCFKTSRAISYFGNAGCVYDVEAMVPLSPGERARVNQIRAMERQYGCR
ncbi:YARHG domain-containing protein [Rhodoplanes azumiensis]|uniref:YARHG domain-containing protein n=1 Tax=Rhodoplanes azumiensis TaxID=1897628 RepID=A0ABW5AFX2_9BRAD